MRNHLGFLVVLFPFLLLASPIQAQDRVPADSWSHFVDPAEAGFDAELLAAAQREWEALDSSAFLVVADGAVVAAWGDVERRFMCHSVRKSFLSALYGIYWDRGQLELNKTLADLGIDDEPSPLLETEQTARILDLLKARSGVFHPAAYAGRTDSRPRGSEGAGRYFAYNNWDFNTLSTILQQETGDSVFESFDEHLGQPLSMQDWRVSDGYFHYERDKSKYPAYPFRMSARDAARFGLLFARRGAWGDQRILSKHWVNRSSALYSIDSDIMGYGFMWWVFREPRFTEHGMFAALGVGNQMIAALPESDLVIVNRADTYGGERTPMVPLLDLIESVLAARTGLSAENPELAPLPPSRTDPRVTQVPDEELVEFVGKWPFPAPVHGESPFTTMDVVAAPGHLVYTSPTAGTFKLFLQPGGAFESEDSQRTYLIARNAAGRFMGFSDPDSLAELAVDAVSEADLELAAELLDRAEGGDVLVLRVTAAVVRLLNEESGQAEAWLSEIARQEAEVETMIDRIGRQFVANEDAFLGQIILQLNTRLHPGSASSWEALAEVCLELGESEEADRSRRKAKGIREANMSRQR